MMAPADQRAPTRFVDTVGHAGQPVRIAVYEEGVPDGPTVVLTHGWPDSHVLWDGVVPLLADRFRLIRYDNRGVGASSVPAAVAAYTMTGLADDLGAVLDAVSPHRPAHVLGHDWGSVATWEFLSRADSAHRLASFTSVSGPGVAQYGSAIRHALTEPHRPMQFIRAVDRLVRFAYWFPFAMPVLSPAAFRLLLSGPRATAVLTGRVPAERRYRGATVRTDAVNSLKIYRNLVRSAGRVRPEPDIDVPVQVVVGTKDPVLRPNGFDGLERRVPRLWRREIVGGHWLPMSHPQRIAAAVGELVDFLESGQAGRALLRAQVGRRRDDFGDTLVSVTCAGSGIGRETALAFAREGAELIVSDIEEAAVKSTAADIVVRGGVAHAYALDVSDAEAVERFADDVCAEHGVPDIVVNNAGVGQAGAFLDTPAEEWDRALDFNLGGVANGCRAFGKRLVERGTGGHMVNVSSSVAYPPAQFPDEAAVYTFSECLRPELDAAGVGLTSICPGIDRGRDKVVSSILSAVRSTARGNKF